MSSSLPPPARTNPRRRPRPKRALWLCAILLACSTPLIFAFPERMPDAVGRIVEDLSGANAHPVKLKRPAVAPLSAMALLGRQIFNDASLSASGRQSCASCHDPRHAYGPANDLPVQLGGPDLRTQGLRQPPSLTYLYRQPNFVIGPDNGPDNEVPVDLAQLATQAAGVPKDRKVAGLAAAPQMVPQGGMFWDGRANTLQQQASGPMFNPAEMANTSVPEVARKLAASQYAKQLVQMFGPNVFKSPALVVDEAMFAVGRYQVEDPSFHPYDSKYDAWLEGKARLSAAELRGLRLFNDADKANCAGCHLSQAGRDGAPPMFTDYQYEALGVPRNAALAQNRDPGFHDLGLCGPLREDLKDQHQYCGMFLTPSLRNTATRGSFFHNGVYRTLDQVLKFYNLRETDPAAIYPKRADGGVDRYDDLPPAYRANVDRTDAPFNRKPGAAPAMSEQDLRDIVAFLHTLDDAPLPK